MFSTVFWEVVIKYHRLRCPDPYHLHFASKTSILDPEYKVKHKFSTFLLISHLFGKKTYREFLESDEGIATNILASRLAQLEQKGLLLKNPYERDKRKDLYVLTEKGLDLLPILLELAGWSAQHDPQTAAPQAWIASVNADKETLIRRIRETVQRGGSIFVGPDSIEGRVEVG